MMQWLIYTPQLPADIDGIALMLGGITAMPGGITLMPGGITFMLGVSIGACFGSFVQAAAMRLNRCEGVISKASACRFCGKSLNWHQNLPIIGWLVSLGRCRLCGERFSPSYLLIEISMAVLGGILAVFYPPLDALMLGVASSLMLICALTDLEKMLLHLPVIWILGGLGLALSLLPFWPIGFIQALLGMIAPVMAIVLINMLYRWWRGVSGFGTGDVWLLAAAGAWLGPVPAIGLFFMASFIGAIFGLMLVVFGHSTGRTALPFGVFISLVFIFMPILSIMVAR